MKSESDLKLVKGPLSSKTQNSLQSGHFQHIFCKKTVTEIGPLYYQLLVTKRLIFC